MNTQTNNFALIGTQEEIINLIQNEIDKYNRSLEQLNLTKQQLSDDYTVIVEQQRDLSAKVRDKRAETQGYGRGSWGLVLGSGYRSARRREASFINAQISRQAADICNNLSAQKNQISARKRTINEEIRKTKQTLRLLKQELKYAKKAEVSPNNFYKMTELKDQKNSSPKKRKSSKHKNNSSQSTMDELIKAKKLLDEGVITPEEFAAFKQKLFL